MFRKIILFSLLLLILASVTLASGTKAGSPITATSTNIVLRYSDGGSGEVSKNAKSDLIADWRQTIKAIHGLLPGDITCPQLAGFAKDTRVYTNVTANVDYVFSFTYYNRSNENVTADAVTVFNQPASRWSYIDPAARRIVEDEAVTYKVTVNSGTAIANEKVTLNVTASITAVESGMGNLNVVSYNVFENVVSSDMQLGAYGGVNDIFNFYVLQAQGFSLTIITRNIDITVPSGYTGGAHDPVPGAKLTYTIVLRNNNTSVATNVDIFDNIPSNCHLYYTDVPTVLGEVRNLWNAGGGGFTPTGNTVPGGSLITFNDVNISGNHTITLNYAVTID